MNKLVVMEQKLPSADNTPQWRRQGEAARALGVTVTTMRRWREMKVGPEYAEFGPRSIRYGAAALQAWLEAHRAEVN